MDAAQQSTVRLLLAAVRDVGFPIVVAGVLLYAVLGAIPAEVGRLTGAMRDAGEVQAQKLDKIEATQQQMLVALIRLLERKGG